MDTSTIQRRRWIILGVLVVGLLAIVIDNTVLNVALKTIASPAGGLGASQSQLEWAINSYTLVFAGLLFTFGVVGDRIGRKRVLMVGLALFGIGSLLSAYSHSPDQLIAARAAMGLGGAAVMPQTLSIIANVFEPQERARAIGIWTSAVGIGVAIGPVLGGLLLTHFWWGSVFLINVPVTAVGLVAAFFLVPESRNPAPGRIDFVGVLGSVLGLVLLIYGVVQGGDGASWLSAGVLGPLLGGLAVLALFVWWEARIEHPQPRRPPVQEPDALGRVGSIALLFFGMGGVYFFTSFYLQNVRGYSPLEAGALAVPFALAQFLMAPRSAPLVNRYGVRAVGVAGMLAERDRDRRLRVHRHRLADLDRRGALLRPGRRARRGHPGRDRQRDAGAAARAGRGRARPCPTPLARSRSRSAWPCSARSSRRPTAPRSARPCRGCPRRPGTRRASITATQALAQHLGPAGRFLLAPADASFVDAMRITTAIAAGLAVIGAIAVSRWMPAPGLPSRKSRNRRQRSRPPSASSRWSPPRPSEENSTPVISNGPLLRPAAASLPTGNRTRTAQNHRERGEVNPGHANPRPQPVSGRDR